MRRFLLPVVLAGVVATLAACSSATEPKGPPAGAVLFKIDAATCTGSAAINLYVDGSLIGTETLSAGGTSKSYAESAGQHLVSAATATQPGRTWPAQTVTVPSGSTYTAVLMCA